MLTYMHIYRCMSTYVCACVCMNMHAWVVKIYVHSINEEGADSTCAFAEPDML